MESIVDVLSHAAGSAGRRPVLQFESGSSFSGDDVLDRTRGFARFAQSCGVKPGDRVVIMLSNRCEFVWAVFGSIYAGAIPVPINTNLKGMILDATMRRIGPALVLVEETTDDAARTALVRTGQSPLLINVDNASKSGDSISFGAALDGSADAQCLVSRPDELATILFTSGTTGPSKGIMYSHGMMLEFADFGRYLFDFGPTDIMYNCLPLFHGNALLLTVLGALRCGGKAVIGDTFSASSYWDSVARSEATIVSLLGMMFPILWNRPPSPSDTDHSVRIGLNLPAPKAYVEQFQDRFGLRLTSLYGLTDVGMPIGVPHWEKPRPGKAGIVHPDWECMVADPNGEQVPDGTPGQLLIRPRRPNITQLGYWGDPEAALALRKDLWFQTGDVLVKDEDGWFTFVDRQKDAIRRSGENISSFEVEMVLQEHPSVAEVAVFALPAELGEDEVAAAIVAESGSVIDERDVIAFAEEHLPYFAVPRYVIVLDELPKTPTAKVKKEDLRRTGLSEGGYDAGPRGRRAGRTRGESAAV